MTDKTGTLTEANMKLVGVYTVKELNEDSDHGGVYTSDDDAVLQLALHNVDVLIENPHDPVSEWTFKGKPFEVHIVKNSTRKKGLILPAYNTTMHHSSFHSIQRTNFQYQNKTPFRGGRCSRHFARSSTYGQRCILRLETWITEASNEGKRLIAVGTVKNSLIHLLCQISQIFLLRVFWHFMIRYEQMFLMQSKNRITRCACRYDHW